LNGDREDSTGRKNRLLHLVSERASVDQLRDDIRDVLVEGSVADRDDMGMVEGTCRGASATNRSARPESPPGRARQHLQGDLALEPRIPGAIHHTAAALADERQDAVRPELLSYTRHCCAHEFWSLLRTAGFIVQR
jgi:hypothetical protein